MEALNDTKIDRAEEIEKMEDDTANMKPSHDPFTPEEEKRLVRKLDFWYDNILSAIDIVNLAYISHKPIGLSPS